MVQHPVHYCRIKKWRLIICLDRVCHVSSTWGTCFHLYTKPVTIHCPCERQIHSTDTGRSQCWFCYLNFSVCLPPYFTHHIYWLSIKYNTCGAYFIKTVFMFLQSVFNFERDWFCCFLCFVVVASVESLFEDTFH